MKIINSFVNIVDRHIVARNRKHNFQKLERMTDRELQDIGLPRELLYLKSANQKRHQAPAMNDVSREEHAA